MSTKCLGCFWRCCISKTLLLMLMIASGPAQAQYTYITNNGTIAIIEYSGPGGSVTIPDMIDGLPVADIREYAFEADGSLTNVVIGNQVTNIGDGAFASCSNLKVATIPGNVSFIGNGAFIDCTNLTSVSLGSGIEQIGDYAFAYCSNLKEVNIPFGVTSLGWSAFLGCVSLIDVEIPDSISNLIDYLFEGCSQLSRIVIPATITNISYGAFDYCPSLARVFFRGDAPAHKPSIFFGSDAATAFYLPGSMNWQDTYADAPTAIWLPLIAPEVGIGELSSHFGFTIDWAKGMDLVVEAATNPDDPAWIGIATNQLAADISRFEDDQSTNHLARMYRLRWP